jgi:FlaA1/EpsC-like NDP-sugar epimerase
VTALLLTTVVRYDAQLSLVRWRSLGLFVALAAALALGIGRQQGLYLGRWRFGSFEEMAALARTTLLVTVVLVGVSLLPGRRLLPLGATLLGPVVALVLMGGARYLWRLAMERRMRPTAGDAVRLIVFGAGEAGTMIVTTLMRNPRGRYLPVALLDDDRSKRNLEVLGVPVLGDRYELARVARELHARAVLVATPSASNTAIRELVELARQADIAVSVLPSVGELVGGQVTVADIRPIVEADLLQRRTIDTDVTTIAGYLTGKRVLVTGAGGSIGSELCRQLHAFSPARLVMLDRDESALHDLQMSIEGRALLDTRNLVVADIRDRPRLAEVFDEHRPEVVFHAAALKHLPLLELHPDEGVKTNVWGTQHVLEVAADHGVERFVNISTDKAADPVSVLGYTKRISERLTATAATNTDRPYLSVRFGNVLGTRGSVVPSFQTQIEAGGPVTVTDAEVTRFFMTIKEAVQLVIQAGAIGTPGGVLILDMGEPVCIADLARILIAASGKEVDITYTGLRPGEKVHEQLVDGDEIPTRTAHPLILQASVPSVDLGELHEALRHIGVSRAERIEQLARLAGTRGSADRAAS